jgi:hypothetical protein
MDLGMNSRYNQNMPSQVETLRRLGAVRGDWEVVSRTPSGLTISLLSCSGGEEVERLTSDDPDLRAYVGARSSSEE